MVGFGSSVTWVVTPIALLVEAALFAIFIWPAKHFPANFTLGGHMKLLTDYSRIIPLFAVIALMAVDANTAIDSSKTSYDPSSSTKMTMALFLPPLIVVAIAVAIGRRKMVALFAAYLSIIIGGYFEYAYYGAGDPSKAVLLIFNVLAYWISCFIALFSFGRAR